MLCFIVTYDALSTKIACAATAIASGINVNGPATNEQNIAATIKPYAPTFQYLSSVAPTKTDYTPRVSERAV